jgi:hypothetical protein
MPETSPELWPKWQSDLYHNVTPPYLRINMTVPTPGDKAERPETPYLRMAENSHKIRAEWRKKRNEEWEANGQPIHLKSNFIGAPTRPSTVNSSASTTASTIAPSTSSALKNNSPKKKKARYRNHNWVWVHYNKQKKKQKKSTKSNLENTEEEMQQTPRSLQMANKILDNLIHAISSNRSLYGHQISTIEDAFMAFDKTGKGSLGINELQSKFNF